MALAWLLDTVYYYLGYSESLTPQQTIERLRSLEEICLKKEEHLNRQIKTEETTAASLILTNKIAAKQALQRKKRFEDELSKNYGVLEKARSQITTLESALLNAEVISILGDVNTTFNGIQQDGETVHELIADIEDHQDLTDEISVALSTQSHRDACDEGELDEEMERLMGLAKNAEASGFGASTEVSDSLPEAPTDKLPAKTVAKKVHGDSVDELEQWAAS
uniref:Charged multivesicular body protein 4b n=1 Tax=Panagrellus redivivus TaxID=6233 RepID=A0A7E4W6F6_PANRE